VIGARYPSPDPVLRDAAAANAIPFVVPERINDEGFLQELRSLAPDVVVSMSYDQIIRAR
jgi:methionyl-tRNA formyltransferase